PAAAGLRPLQQVVGLAEGAGDPLVAPVADHEDAAVAERTSALGAPTQRVVGLADADDRAGLPVGDLDEPRDDVLQAAEGCAALALGLGHAEAIILGNRLPTPCALIGHGPSSLSPRAPVPSRP